MAREAAAGAVTPRSGGDATVRRGHHGPAGTPRFGGDAMVRRRRHGSAGGRRLRGPETEMAGTANCTAR